jgi:hypothetical protein
MNILNSLDQYFGKNVNDLYSEFEREYYADSLLVNHRTHIENNCLGYGERAFHTLWRELVKAQPSQFKFLEIGVYKGQILSLVKLLAKHYKKDASVIGVTPLSPAGDKYSNYDDVDYLGVIEQLFSRFELEFNASSNLIIGSSQIDSIKNRIIENGPFDLIFIDGCHDYDCVVSDISLAKTISQKDSIIVFDDSANFIDMSNLRWRGHLEVSQAVRDHIENDKLFEEILCIGHNRAFKRTVH